MGDRSDPPEGSCNRAVFLLLAPGSFLSFSAAAKRQKLPVADESWSDAELLPEAPSIGFGERNSVQGRRFDPEPRARSPAACACGTSLAKSAAVREEREAMYYGLYLSAAGAHAQSQKIEVLSNNLANVNTVGFKRELALLAARDSEAIERGLVARGTQAIEDIGGGTRFWATFTDFSPGTLQRTEIPTDLAIDSPDAFFLVARGSQRLLTRAGNFHLAPDGRLLTAQGDAVLSSDGEPIQIDPTLPWRFVPGGVLEQAGERMPLALVRPRELAALQKVGENYFQSPLAPEPVPEEQRQVRSGYLEMSAVRPVEEMVELIAASRAYEANVRIIQQHDAATSQLIGRLLRA